MNPALRWAVSASWPGRMRALALILSLSAMACGHSRGLPSGAGAVQSPAETAIRDARIRFNEALAARDLKVIGSFLLPTYHIVTGRSVQAHGRDSALESWTALFRDPTLHYIRSTRTVYVNETWGLAEELGDWKGQFTASDGPVRASGVYAAKWQRDDGGRWRLQAEVFTTLACEGGAVGCTPPVAITKIEN